jgi:hypothetical protein
MAAPAQQEWLGGTIRTLRRADRDVLQILEQSRRDIELMFKEIEKRPGIGALIRREQLLLVKRNLQREQAKIWTRLGDVIQARRLEAAVRAIDLARRTDASLLQSLGKSQGEEIAKAIADAERDTAERSIDRMVSRVNGDSYIPLSEKVYRSKVSINSRIDRMVNSALARGLSAKEFAGEIRDYINPNTPGGLRYASMRLARTEINNAAHAVAIDSVQGKPWVSGMKWHLSSSHPRVDVCNNLASGGHNGLGVYPKDQVPAKPHPHCLCFVTPETPTDDEFLDHLLGGQYNDYLEKYSPGISKRLGGLTAPPAPASPPAPVKAHRAAKATPAKKTPAKAVLTQPQKIAAAKAHVDAITAKLPIGNGIQATTKATLNKQSRLTPTVVTRLREIRMGTQKDLVDLGHPQAVAGYWPDERRMSVFGSIFTPAGDRVAEKSVRTGWWSQCVGSGASSTISHEFGHHVHNMMLNATTWQRQTFWDIVAKELQLPSPGSGSGQIVSLWVRTNTKTIKTAVSEYATTNDSEFLAEIWAEFSTNPNARPHIKAIGEAMQKLAEESA